MSRHLNSNSSPDATSRSLQHAPAPKIEGNSLAAKHSSKSSEVDGGGNYINSRDDDDLETSFPRCDSSSSDTVTSQHRMREAFSTWCEIMAMTSTVGKHVMRSQQEATNTRNTTCHELGSDNDKDGTGSNKRRKHLPPQLPPPSSSPDPDSKTTGGAATKRMSSTSGLLSNALTTSATTSKWTSIRGNVDPAATRQDHDTNDMKITARNTSRPNNRECHEAADERKSSVATEDGVKTSLRRKRQNSDSDSVDPKQETITAAHESQQFERMRRALICLQTFQIQFAALIGDEDVTEYRYREQQED